LNAVAGVLYGRGKVLDTDAPGHPLTLAFDGHRRRLPQRAGLGRSPHRLLRRFAHRRSYCGDIKKKGD
jgi:hypothetical protein